MKKEKVIISSLILSLIYDISKTVQILSISGKIYRIGSKWIKLDLASLVNFNLTKNSDFFVPALSFY